jgi:hypothetical protein
MNKLIKPASNCRTIQIGNDASCCIAGGIDETGSIAAGGICSYTNDVARAAETCQAPFEAKTTAAD